MKWLPSLILLMLAAACSEQSAEDNSNDILAEKHAHADAMRAISAPEGSMQRERAIMHIHATQEAILQAGDTTAAIKYIDHAKDELRKAGVIE